MWLYQPEILEISLQHIMQKEMGLPIAKFICASNENKVLYDFFTTGTYDKNREFYPDVISIYGYFDFQ